MSRSKETLGDPDNLAQHQFELAQRLCGTCRDYHANWPYRRLAGVIVDLEGDAAFLTPVLGRVTPRNGHILISGASDAGTLALVAQSTAGLAPAITVADRCPTPLAVCQRYAETRPISLTTCRADLRHEPIRGLHDVILMHGFLRFVPAAGRPDFFRNLKASLTPAGRLVVVEILPRRTEEQSNAENYAQHVIAALKARGVALPEKEEFFRGRLEEDVQRADKRHAEPANPGDLSQLFEDAGLRVESRTQYERLRPIAADTVLHTVISQVTVATLS